MFLPSYLHFTIISLLLLILQLPQAVMPYTLGLLTDIQYADVPDGHSYSGKPRYYRHSLNAAAQASRAFNDLGVDAVLNLGDTVDGKSAGSPKDALNEVLVALSSYKGKIHHAYGNHELYCHERGDLFSRTGQPFETDEGEMVGCYAVDAGPDWRLVFLDTYDISHLGRKGVKKTLADRILSENNPNFGKGEINSPVGLTGVDRRYVAFNGGLSDFQLSWLDAELSSAESSGKKAIVLSHQPFHPLSTNPMCLPLNYLSVLSLLQKYSSTVRATFSGHTHSPGYHYSSGIHHVVFAAVLESPPPVATYAVVTLGEGIKIDGRGDQPSYDLPLDSEGGEL